jgi:hypothetical protein
MALWAATGLAQAAIARPAFAHDARHAEFGTARASRDTVLVANGVVASGDNEGAPFIILDKVNARVFVFDANGRMRAFAPALLGIAKGDDTVPGIGDKKIADIKPEERTTPAGRFVAEFGESSSRGEDVVWVDYDAAVSMHRVVTSNPKEHRLQRLATPSPKDNRISYGCINLPKAFYEKWVGPMVAQTRTIIYVLPETRPARQVFGFLETKWDRLDARSRGMRASAVAKALRAGPPEGLPMPFIDQ